MVLAIFLSFVACYLPITIVKVADVEVKYPGIIKRIFYITVLKKIERNVIIFILFILFSFSLRISRFGLPVALLRLLREPDYLRDHEQTI